MSTKSTKSTHEHERLDHEHEHERTAQDIARERVADVPALQSTDERTRPVAITSEDERAQRAERDEYAVTVAHGSGRRTVVRVQARDADHARALVAGNAGFAPAGDELIGVEHERATATIDNGPDERA